VHHHGAGLRRALQAEGISGDEQERLIDSLQAHPVPEELWPAGDRALLAYADKLTRTPSAIDAADIDRLRSFGFDDAAIHDACAIVAYYAFVNRIADGLGVELESPEPE
jgi:alkylhydroperoxidase family enzyme